MAGVRGPLFGFDASGAIANTLVWSKWKGRPYVRQLVIPSNPDTIFQRGVRAVFGFCARNFAALSDPNKALWQDVADTRQITALNAMISDAQNQRATGGGPRQNPTTAAGAAIAAPTINSDIEGEGRWSVTFTLPATAIGYATHVYRQVADTAPVSSELVGVVYTVTSAGQYTFEETNVPAGTWHYKLRVGNTTGVLGTASADGTVVVT